MSVFEGFHCIVVIVVDITTRFDTTAVEKVVDIPGMLKTIVEATNTIITTNQPY